MRSTQALVTAGFIILSAASDLVGAGFVHNENFVVFTERTATAQTSQQLAESVLREAEAWRCRIARQWFGEPLPPGIGRTTINVTFSQDRNSGLTWAADAPGRKLHTVYLTLSPDNALSDTLAHEMAHVVLATRFPHPHRLPAWVEEGIASQYDGDQRRRVRGEALRWIRRTGNWPDVAGVLQAENISADDTVSYVIATTLTEMLLADRGKSTFLQFAEQATRTGWQEALREHYDIGSAEELQRAWQHWVTRVPDGNALSAR